jgi:hypothetical protein
MPDELARPIEANPMPVGRPMPDATVPTGSAMSRPVSQGPTPPPLMPRSVGEPR